MLLGGAVAGYHPLWPAEEPTVSEAILLRDLGTLHRWLERRVDLSQQYPVRPGMINDRALRLTPFEAVIAARRDDVLLFLRARGIHPSAQELPRLRCLAAQKEARDVLALLGGAPPPDACGTAPVVSDW